MSQSPVVAIIMGSRSDWPTMKCAADALESRIAEMKERGEALRDDDSPEVLRNRLKAYRDQTAPLIAYYRQRGLLRTVNGMAPIPEVAAAIDQALPVEPSSSRPVREGLKKNEQPSP